MKSTRGERLRLARRRRFRSARAAAASLGLPAATYGAHERAESLKGRDYGPDEAVRYGQHFQVSPEWLLTGRVPQYTLALAEDTESHFKEGSEEPDIENHLRFLAMQAETISLELERALGAARRALIDRAGHKPHSDDVAQTVSRLIDSLDAAAGLIYSLASELDPNPSPLARMARGFSRKRRDRAKGGVDKKRK